MPSRLSAPDDVRAALARWIPPGSDVAIVDVPVHRNIGDLFILAASRHLLNNLGCRVVFASGVRDYHPAAIRRVVTPETVIVGLGGGNFGDLYPTYQTLRERVAAEFPDHRIVVLPQTVHYSDPQAFERSASRLRRHRHLHVAARDVASVEFAKQMTPHVALMADIVDVFGREIVARGERTMTRAEPRARLAHDGSLVLLRRDAERSGASDGRHGVDWSDLFPGFTARLALAAALMPMAPGRLSARLHESWATLATTMLVEAVAVMRHATRVVTDRLHGAVVARIAGRPVTLIDNSYGKLGAYRNLWWRDDASVEMAALPRRT